MKKWKQIEDIFLGILYFSLSCILLLGGKFILEQEQLNKLTRGFYGENSIFLNIIQNQKKNEMFNFKSIDNNKNYIIYKDYLSLESDIRGVYVNGEIEEPPIIKGRFFLSKDFYDGKKVAVVGKSVHNNIVSKNGVKYFIYQDTYFKIIGIMGTSFDSKIDKAVFLNLDAIYAMNQNISGSYVIDGVESTRDIFNQLQKSIFESYKVVKIDHENNGADRFFDNKRFKSELIACLSLVFISTSMVVSNYWMDRKKTLIMLQHLIGHKNFYILSNLFLKYLFITTISYSMGILFIFLINTSFYLDHIQMFYKYSLQGYGIVMFFGFLSLLLILKKASIENSLKGLR